MRKIKKDNNKTMIIILIVIAVIMIMILVILNLVKNLKSLGIIDNTSVNSDDIYNSVYENTNNKTLKDAIEAADCVYINQQRTRDEDDNRISYIYVEFKYDLYEGNTSKEEYFNKIIRIVKKYEKYNFELIDESRNIKISCYLNDPLKINDVEDYFNNNHYLEVMGHKNKTPIDTMIASKVLNKFEYAGLKMENLNSNQEFEKISNNKYQGEGFVFTTNKEKINSIIFNKDFKDEIILGVKPGNSFKQIKENLGEPNYTDGNRMIGYDLDLGTMYIYNDEIVLYPSVKETQSLFEKFVYEFINNDTADEKVFFSELMFKYSDFQLELIEGGKRYVSYARGIEFRVLENGEIKIYCYDNYQNATYLKQYEIDGLINIDYDNDLLYSYEKERRANN